MTPKASRTLTLVPPVDSQDVSRYQAIDPPPPVYDDWRMDSVVSRSRGHEWRWVACVVVIAIIAIGAVISI